MLLHRDFHHFILLFLIFLQFPFLIFCSRQEVEYLQRAKDVLDASYNGRPLSNWNLNDTSPCHWIGITCDLTGSVTSIDLTSFNLAGPFPSVLCNLSNLTFLSFNNNSLNSTLFQDDLARCQALEYLDLSENFLNGKLPHRLADLPNLKHLDLSANYFTSIPENYGTFPKLENLSLVYNLIEAEIPSFLGNISTLKHLNLSYNPFSQGRIPAEIGNLTNLEVLWLAGSNLIGEVPVSLGRLSKLVDLDLNSNSLTGPIPSSVMNLTGLVQLELYNNSFTGNLPANGWLKMKSLRLVDVSMNNLTGQIPVELCELPLVSLRLYQNHLQGGLPDAIGNSPNLIELIIFENNLSGELPQALGKNSPLLRFDVADNNFSGQIPETLCHNGDVEELIMIGNSFSGEVPAALGECKSLLRLRLAHNSFSGEVPAGIWGLPHVGLIELAGNSFSGGIEKAIASSSKLSQLILSGNSFSGGIPEELGFLGNLVEVSFDNNKFSGSLPSSIINLENLAKLDLQNNAFSGKIPSGIHYLTKLTEVDLSNNEFSGEIPGELGDLPVLNYLDLSGNQFSGKIPIGLQNLKLSRFNLSNNHLSGDIPPMYAKGVYKDSFLGNPGLCGDIKGLCVARRENISSLWFWRLIFVLSGLVLIGGLALYYMRYVKPKFAKKSMGKKWTLTSFHKLGFSEDEILNSLDEDNVIGSGSSGKVYRVVCNNGESVAVKKLWENSKSEDDNCVMEKGNLKNDGFEAEIDTLGKIRHKNIVKLWCSFSTKDCRMLVYEYMPNGSLGDLLHSTKSGLLDWPIRFKIALDAAEGLSYLHHDCAPPIVHRDVKSNNILLDSDFSARVADFGVAKVVDDNGNGGGIKSMSNIAGSRGYIAPEYAYTLHVNEKSDIYSFGVVIFELVTGKLPVDPEFGEKDLVKWVRMTLDGKGIDHVIDQKLDSCFKDDICSVLNIGLLCTSPVPINRPSMRRVVKVLEEMGSSSQSKNNNQNDGELTPYYFEDASDQGSIV